MGSLHISNSQSGECGENVGAIAVDSDGSGGVNCVDGRGVGSGGGIIVVLVMVVIVGGGDDMVGFMMRNQSIFFCEEAYNK